MTARILVVDDVEANVRLLEAKLTAEYYDVIRAFDGHTALAMAASEQPDIILLDVMMPGLDGFEVCRRLKDDPATRHIPVVLVTALDGRQDRVGGLDAGADEFLTKPVEDLFLFARVRALTRLKFVIDELRKREESGRRLGVIESAGARLGGTGGRVLVVDDNERQAQRIATELAVEHRPVVESEFDKALLTARGPVDLIIVNAASKAFDGLRFAAQIRSDFLRNNLDQSLELAVTDSLTGLHNRRYMTGQLKALAARAAQGGEPVAVLLMDIDHFKSVNDGYGHDVGDLVLQEFAARLATNVRAVDLPCRYGGEEFAVVMPETSLEDAKRIAERIRLHVAGSPFRIGEAGDQLTVTISIGVAATNGLADSPDALLKRADSGLYEAKSGGRNRVVTAAA